MKYIFVLLSFTSFYSWAGDGRAADLQYYLCDDPGAVRDAFDLKKSDSASRSVFLFENSALEMFHHGLQIRLRVKKGKSKLSVKRFDLSEDEWSRDQKEIDGKCEMDVHDGGRVNVLSCSVDKKISDDAAEDLVEGRLRWSDVLNRQQQELLKQAGVDLENGRWDLRALGSVKSRAWDFHLSSFHDEVSLEEQKFPSGRHYIEFSVKTNAGDLNDRMRSVEQLFQSKNLTLCPDQTGQRETKLRELLSKVN